MNRHQNSLSQFGSFGFNLLALIFFYSDYLLKRKKKLNNSTY